MTSAQLSALLADLLTQPNEAEWLEFKHNNDNPEMIGEYISALSNSAALHGRDTAYIVWGIEDGTRQVVGTTFKPPTAKKGGQELESWLLHSLQPQVAFKMREWTHGGQPMVLFEIPRAVGQPVAFKGERYIRVGSQKESLRSNSAKEGQLWATLSKEPFEQGIAKADLASDEVLNLIDFTGCFDMLRISLPTDQAGILARLVNEGVGDFSLCVCRQTRPASWPVWPTRSSSPPGREGALTSPILGRSCSRRT